MDYNDLKDALLHWQTSKLDSNDTSLNSKKPQSNKPVTRNGARGGVSTPFPDKLHRILESHEFDEFISWQPNGRSFILHDVQGFVTSVMPIFFKQTKFRSFQRQLNLYEFKRISFGTYIGGYYHPKFLRNQPELCKEMTRVAVKSQLESASRNVRNRSHEVTHRKADIRSTYTHETVYTPLASSEYEFYPSETRHGAHTELNDQYVTTPMINKLFSQPCWSKYRYISPDIVNQKINVQDLSNAMDGMATESIHSSTIHNTMPQINIFGDYLSDDISFPSESDEIDFSRIF
jgi:hypothetical protein